MSGITLLLFRAAQSLTHRKTFNGGSKRDDLGVLNNTYTFRVNSQKKSLYLPYWNMINWR